MQFKLTSFVAFLAAAVVSAQVADPSINTPSGVVQCLPIQITYSGTAPPFFITIHPGGNTGAAALVDLGSNSGNSITWIANQPAGTSLTMVIRDSQGRTNPSATFTVLPGTDSSCLGKPGNVATTAGGSPATTAGGSAGSTAAGGSSAGGAASTTRPASSAAASPSNAAMSIKPVGFAGLVGMVGLAALI